MSKIEVRLPNEQYAYHGVWFDSLEDYEKDYVKVLQTIDKKRKEYQDAKEKERTQCCKDYPSCNCSQPVKKEPF